MISVKCIYKMSREELLEYLKLMETKIQIYSERDWLTTEAYISEAKRVDMILLEMYTNDTIEKGA